MSARTANFYDDSLTKEFQNLKILAPHEVLKLEKKIEILREQVEKFRQLMHQQNQKIQDSAQELIDTKHKLMLTNHELCIALQPGCRY